ncbi:MAG: hypothetical protein J6K90_06255 [Tidjanibacter sp.]|nr:hypothetical protein [Tidjanibacter sp.]
MRRFSKIALLLLAIMVVAVVSAHNFVVGQKMPPVVADEWIEEPPKLKDGVVLVDFFSSLNATVMTHVPELKRFAKEYEGRMQVVVASKDPMEVMTEIFGDESGCYIALDRDGKLFSAFKVRFVPCTMLLDKRGRLLWAGDVLSLTDDRLEEFLVKKEKREKELRKAESEDKE